MLEGTHHIAVIASNEQKALDFYVNKLGFSIEKETGGLPKGTVCGCCGWEIP